MKAKEMFKKLGYKERRWLSGTLDSCSFSYVSEDGIFVSFINFAQAYYSNMGIDVELHKAITQQMEELGWLPSSSKKEEVEKITNSAFYKNEILKEIEILKKQYSKTRNDGEIYAMAVAHVYMQDQNISTWETNYEVLTNWLLDEHKEFISEN